MPRIGIYIWLGMTCAGLVPAQRLYMATEFQRIGPDGQVIAADRVERRREIISPAIARNAHASFRVVVEMPPGVSYTLFAAQNPDRTVDYQFYQEKYQRNGEAWVADELDPLELPHAARLNEGQKVQTYLLDMWVPPDAPAGRIRFEMQLNVDGRWVIYPMEVRIQNAVAKNAERYPARGVVATERADAGAAAAARSALCNQKTGPGPVQIKNLRQVIIRNALEDLTLARGSEELSEMIPRAAGYANAEAFCRAALPAPAGAEWWLRLRDYFYQGKRLP